LRAPMIHQYTHFCTRQRIALKNWAGNLAISCGAPPCALDEVMR
jgi:hypothetical protein